MNLARIQASRAITLARTLESEPPPGNPNVSAIKEATRYNKRRCEQNDRRIRDAHRVLSFQFALDLLKRLPEDDYSELGTFRRITGSLIFARKTAGAAIRRFDRLQGFETRELKDARLDWPRSMTPSPTLRSTSSSAALRTRAAQTRLRWSVSSPRLPPGWALRC